MNLPGSRYCSYAEFLKDREIEYPLSEEANLNMLDLLLRLDVVRKEWGRPLTISSGYRPGRYNKTAGGATTSAHLTCEAADLVDKDGTLAKFCAEAGRLEGWNLYMENPTRTPGWVHLQSRRPKSGNRIFNP